MRNVFVCGISRSGTTLLATILDSHPQISMGYELVHADLPPADEIAALIDRAWSSGATTARACGNRLQEWGHHSAGTFVKRCARTLVDPPELASILRSMDSEGRGSLGGARAGLRLALRVAEVKAGKERAVHCGFKVGPYLLPQLRALVPDAGVLCIVRDPRDAIASQRSRGMATSTRRAALAWTSAAEACRRTAATQAHVGLLRYEDLVSRPEATLRRAFETLGIPFAPEVLRFFDSKASVHREGQRHANAENLRRDFFDTSVGRWKADLEHRDVVAIERLGFATMAALGYPPSMRMPGGRPMANVMRLAPRLRNWLRSVRSPQRH